METKAKYNSILKPPPQFLTPRSLQWYTGSSFVFLINLNSNTAQLSVNMSDRMCLKFVIYFIVILVDFLVS